MVKIIPQPASASYASFHDAYLDQLGRVYHGLQFRNAPRGFPSRERIGVQYTVLDPRQRVPVAPARRVNIVFNFAEALWYLSGRNDLDFIAYYASSMNRYSMDGRTLTGTAYGRKLFGAEGGRSQWDSVVSQLRDDPDSKRAVMQIFDGAELQVEDNIDVSCTLGLQFLLRDAELHLISYMRANDAYRGMVSDVFSFTLLQEFLATELGVGLGSYIHTVGSLHIYLHDDQRVREVLSSPTPAPRDRPAFPAMPSGSNWPVVHELLKLEEALRDNRHRISPDISGLGLPGYWSQVLLLFEFYRRLRVGEPTAEIVGALHPLYRDLVTWRWRKRTEAAR
jgi:thymidylate synthase